LAFILKKLPHFEVMRFITPLLASLATFSTAAFVHPGLLQTNADFTRISAKVAAGTEPWATAWEKFTASPYSAATYTPQAVSAIYRGLDGTHAENYWLLYQDVAAAYALAIRWKVTGIAQYGNAAIEVLDAWSSTLTLIGGDSDLYLAAGIYGYEFAQAGEIMRSYPAWTNFARFQNLMVNVFYSQINDWFVNHDAGTYGQYAAGVYAGWDLCMMAGAVAIGVMVDDQAIYNQGYNWFFTGTGNGQIFKVWTRKRSGCLSHIQIFFGYIKYANFETHRPSRISTGMTTKTLLNRKKLAAIRATLCWTLHYCR
jgi:hypothetical protein